MIIIKMTNYVFAFSLLLMQTGIVNGDGKVLNVMGLLPITGEKWPGGGACFTAAQMAARHVNERDDILKEYKLNLTLRDGAVRIVLYLYF